MANHDHIEMALGIFGNQHAFSVSEIAQAAEECTRQGDTKLAMRLWRIVIRRAQGSKEACVARLAVESS